MASSDDDELVVVETSNKGEVTSFIDNDEGTDTTESDNFDTTDDDDDDDDTDVRDRRRDERKQRRERQRAAISRSKLELDFLRSRNEELEKRVVNVERSTMHSNQVLLDKELETAVKEARLADEIVGKALSAGNGNDANLAMKYRDEASRKIQQINAVKQQLLGATRQQNAQQTQPVEKVHPETLSYAMQFLQDNPWYDRDGKDEDSKIVLAIDNSITSEGWDPTKEGYWAELNKRVRKRLPDKFKQRGGPPVSSGRDHNIGANRSEIYISSDRKKALMEAGVWDDPVLRAKYVKRYAEWDRNNKRGA